MHNLPKGITTTSYNGDIVLSGPDMSSATFAEIKRELSPDHQKNLLGWIRTGNRDNRKAVYTRN